MVSIIQKYEKLDEILKDLPKDVTKIIWDFYYTNLFKKYDFYKDLVNYTLRREFIIGSVTLKSIGNNLLRFHIQDFEHYKKEKFNFLIKIINEFERFGYEDLTDFNPKSNQITFKNCYTKKEDYGEVIINIKDVETPEWATCYLDCYRGGGHLDYVVFELVVNRSKKKIFLKIKDTRFYIS